MEKSREHLLLGVLVFLSIIAFVTSLYLVRNHFETSAGSFCDFGETVSCSLVNSSIYSEFLHVPVALLGALWALFLTFLSWKAMKKRSFLLALVLWSVIGLGAVLYFIAAEIILKALCPLCTVVHVIVLISLVISLVLYTKYETKIQLREFWKDVRGFVLLIIIVNTIPFIIFNIPEKESNINVDALAQCINASGVNMYGSFRCGVCAKERALFGDSFQYIHEIECHPEGENPQTELCLAKGIAGTPTWILEPNSTEMKRFQGFMDFEDLATFTGCSLQ